MLVLLFHLHCSLYCTLLCSAPVLKAPDFSKPFILQTDASDRGIGAVLSQIDENGDDHQIAYFSKNLLPREQRYSTVEKECLAIKLATHAIRVYLLGRKLIIQTDHRALKLPQVSGHPQLLL